MADRALLPWLLNSDPSLRWQVERDLAHEPEGVWQATRIRVTAEGFGAELLSRQDENGQWAGGAYFPADATEDEPGQPWTATTWSLNALREWGVQADALRPLSSELFSTRWQADASGEPTITHVFHTALTAAVETLAAVRISDLVAEQDAQRGTQAFMMHI